MNIDTLDVISSDSASTISNGLVFTLFPDLPTELRLKIWTAARFHDRNIDIWHFAICEHRVNPTWWKHLFRSVGEGESMNILRGKYIYSQLHTKLETHQLVPSILTTCRESREIGLKHYTQTSGFKCVVNIPEHSEYILSTPPRIWLNLTTDIVFLSDGINGSRLLDILENPFGEEYKIRRIALEADKFNKDSLEPDHLSQLISRYGLEEIILCGVAGEKAIPRSGWAFDDKAPIKLDLWEIDTDLSTTHWLTTTRPPNTTRPFVTLQKLQRNLLPTMADDQAVMPAADAGMARDEGRVDEAGSSIRNPKQQKNSEQQTSPAGPFAFQDLPPEI
ncbi:hypothetical protein G7Y89_g1205 [Cudoniella acicularis]|uniref:2EXR domain-containing protein n=1 Tax=Cudoniella acicularis TaxID=354080 RepID=A0A8H4RWJ3_9HELO|nr:hypothetical protein G7Y89_g1205 [Cudoniella acicularis]